MDADVRICGGSSAARATRAALDLAVFRLCRLVRPASPRHRVGHARPRYEEGGNPTLFSQLPLAHIPRGCFNAAARESVEWCMVAIALHGLPLFDHSHGVQEILTVDRLDAAEGVPTFGGA